MPQNTLEAIHMAAKKEFLEKGFKSASLRNIVKSAGVTTGAFYGYYKSKEQLFEALVAKQYNTVMSTFRKSQQDFAQLPPEKQPNNLGNMSSICMHEMLVYIYDNLEEFKLLLCCSQGTRFAAMIDEMIQVETEGTDKYKKVLEKLGHPSKDIDSRLEHILITGLFNAFFELVIHKMPFEQAEKYLCELSNFYTAGWKKIMGQ